MEELHIAFVGEWFDNEDGFEFLSDQNMNEYDFIVIESDTFIKAVKDKNDNKVERRIAELKEFIILKNIPVVFICFDGSPFYSHGEGKTLTGLFNLDVIEVPVLGKKIEINPDSLFADFLKKYSEAFEYQVSFSKYPGTSIGKAKNRANSIGFYTKDFVFLPGLSDSGFTDLSDFLTDLYPLCRAVRMADESIQVPDWANEYLLPGEQKEREQLTAIENELKQLHQAKTDAELRLSNFLPLKQLWTASGFTLEKAVRQVFIELGFQILPSEENRDDLIMEYNGQIVVAEIKGQNKSAAEKNAAQLEKWVSTYYENKGQQPKGLLIVNTFREIPLAERTLVSFPNQMLKYSVSRDHCLITTLQLCTLMLYCRDYVDQREIMIEKLLQTIGCFEEFDNWTDYIVQQIKAPAAAKSKKKTTSSQTSKS